MTDEWGWYDHTEPRRERDRDYEIATWERIIADQRRAKEARDQARQRDEAADDKATAGDEGKR